MGIFNDMAHGLKSTGDTLFVKPVNNIQKGVNNAKDWTVGAAEDTFHEIKSDVGAGFNWTGQQISKVTDIFDNNIIWIVVGIGLVVVLLK